MPADRAGVSVVICTHNGYSTGFLAEAIASALRQTVPPGEILLVDDGSSDETRETIRTQFPQVTILPRERAGLPAARNAGIAASRFPWIAFLDDDDVWHEEKLEVQLALAASSAEPARTLFCDRIALIDAKGVPCGSVPVPTHRSTWPACLVGWAGAAPSATLFSRHLLNDVGPFDASLRYGSAYQYWLRCLAAGVSIQYSSRVLSYHRVHDRQMTRPSKQLDNELQVDRFLPPFLARFGPRMSRRLAWARMFVAARGLTRVAPARAWTYLRETPIRPRHWSARAAFFIVLDSLALPLRGRAGDALRQFAANVLVRP